MLPCGMGPQTALHHAAVHHPTIPIATRSRVCKADEPTIGRAGSRRALLLAFSFLAFLSFLPALSLLATITVSPLGVALPRTAVPFVAILPRLPALTRSLSPILQCNRRSEILLLAQAILTQVCPWLKLLVAVSNGPLGSGPNCVPRALKQGNPSFLTRGHSCNRLGSGHHSLLTYRLGPPSCLLLPLLVVAFHTRSKP